MWLRASEPQTEVIGEGRAASVAPSEQRDNGVHDPIVVGDHGDHPPAIEGRAWVGDAECDQISDLEGLIVVDVADRVLVHESPDTKTPSVREIAVRPAHAQWRREIDIRRDVTLPQAHNCLLYTSPSPRDRS